MVSIEIRCSRDRSLRISGAIISGNVSADASPPPPSSPLLFDYRAFFVGTGERELACCCTAYVLVSSPSGGFRGFIMGRF